MALVAVDGPIVQDLRYATAENFTHQKLYSAAVCWLQPETARRLEKVALDLKQQGWQLKVWDCYRPLSVQKAMWALVPDAQYVANPATGSRHNRGASVDVTLAGAEMGSNFDEFGPKAHVRAAGLTAEERRHREILRTAMLKQGFLPLATEWWHFDDPHWAKYPVLDQPLAAGAPPR